MQRYLLQRLALVPVVAALVATAVFVLVRFLPGDVMTVLASEAPQYGDSSSLRSELGLDKPLLEQYGDFMGGIVQGDFGNSLFFKRPVREDIVQAVPVTVELTILAVLLSVVIAVPLGVLTATRRGGPIDVVMRILSVLFHAVPTFWLGTLALTFLAIIFAWTPPLQYTPIWKDPIENLQQFAIPTVVLAIGTLGLKMRLVRSQMLEVLNQDYIRTAHAKGLSGSSVMRTHALRNAMVPVVAIIGNQAGALLGGAAILETMFNLPGLGRVLIAAVDHRDYPEIQSTALVIALFLVAVNLITDVVYAWLDPRIRFA
ncbi:hypothetical protein AYO38_08895 [bacterium SCGC AG-212-C10]|nr:hypothetical protein AYO38_08895 [bacterium SCGC AG-212-C10]